MTTSSRIETVRPTDRPGFYRTSSRYVTVPAPWVGVFALASQTGQLVCYNTDGQTSTVVFAALVEVV